MAITYNSFPQTMADLRLALPLVEEVQCGSSVLLHNMTSKALVLTDSKSVSIMRKQLESFSGSKENIPEPWITAGLFNDTSFTPDNPVPRSTVDAVHHLNFIGPAGSICVILSDERLSLQLKGILGRHLTSKENPKKVLLKVAQEGSALSVYQNGKALTERHSRDEVRFFLIRLICETILGFNNVAASLHGAAVALDDKAILLIGPSGKGKTTTALGLLHQGGTQLSDDHVALHAEGGDVIAFPVAIGLKPGSWDLPEAQGLVAVEAGRNNVRYVEAPRTATPGRRVSISAIIFPAYEAGSELHVKSMTPEEALLESFAAGCRVSKSFRSIKPLARLFNEIPSSKISYSCMSDVMSACKVILRR